MRHIDNTKRIFNYRLSRGRKAIECVFGMMSQKFQILSKPITCRKYATILFFMIILGTRSPYFNCSENNNADEVNAFAKTINFLQCNLILISQLANMLPALKNSSSTKNENTYTFILAQAHINPKKYEF